MTRQQLDRDTLRTARSRILNEAVISSGPGNGTRPMSDGLYRAVQMLGDMIEPSAAAATFRGAEKNLAALDVLFDKSRGQEELNCVLRSILLTLMDGGEQGVLRIRIDVLNDTDDWEPEHGTE
jgi:hypothetical protein